MSSEENRLIEAGRMAAQKNDWRTVYTSAHELIRRNKLNPEGFFLLGLAERAARQTLKSIDAFEKCLALDERRFDAGVELANQYHLVLRNDEAIGLLEKYDGMLVASPWHLDMSGTLYITMGKPLQAIPLFEKAVKLQPDALFFLSHLASAYVFVGEIERAKAIYQKLLLKNPNHQRNHFYLARLETATGTDHVEEMKAVLKQESKPDSANVFIHYALGKEQEDLENWDEAFDFYRKAGNGVKAVLKYRVEQDEALIEQIIRSCDEEWYQSKLVSTQEGQSEKRPILLVGLPRTGTTLAEQILAGHSKIESIGETQYFELVLRANSDVNSAGKMTPEIVASLVKLDTSNLAAQYLEKTKYLWGDKAYFIDKLPHNYLYLGFFAAAFPDSPIIWIRRNPMDACLAMYKQLFTGVYEFTYDFDDLARFYVMYDKLYRHWKSLLGDRIVEIEYEDLVTNTAETTRAAFDNLKLDYEPECIDFNKNISTSSTASSVQIREKIHSRSVMKWKQFEKHLEPLRSKLEAAGIEL
ncbi:MAG: sulfotransferase [Xanthomonadales bacterium]|nr:sulfotransferase [Xanthomonadales bacterium]